MKFIVDSSPANFSWMHGGIIVLHKLAKLLADFGHDVYIVSPSTDKTLPNSKCKVIRRETAKDLCRRHDELIVIYPEIIVGNPYGAKHVVRWLLYYPGAINKKQSTYDESEFVFAYHRGFVSNTTYENSPLLFVLETNVDVFYPLDMPREYDAILVRKGNMNGQTQYNERYVKYFLPNSDLITNQHIIVDEQIKEHSTPEEMNRLFNTIKYFVTFDHATYHSILASLAGCISVVIPVDGLEKETWKQKLPINKYGVAYGFDDIDWAVQTRDDLRNRLHQIETENMTNVLDFINLIGHKWNLQ